MKLRVPQLEPTLLKTIKPQKLGILTRCYERQQQFFLGVSVLAFIPLSAEPSLYSEVELWKFAAAELGKDAALDAGLPKVRGEFLVTGSAFMPDGRPREGCKVGIRLGGREKTLHVYGDRQWRNGFSGEPEPFLSMPIDWAHAYGGEGYAANPVGKGFKPVMMDNVSTHWIPNILYSSERVVSPDDQIEPAGFGPVDLTWPQRFAKAGTHDDLWLREDFPGFARDIDWTMFNMAPPDQWFEQHLRGDEPYKLENMHPTKPLIESCLPGFVARCFVNRRTEKGESFDEIAVSLSTVWFFPHRERAILIFHGMTPLIEDDAADILHMIIAAENAGRPKGEEYYRDLMARRLDKETGPLLSLRDRDLLPEGLAGAGDLPTDEGIPIPEGLLKKNLRNKAEKKIAEARALVASYGLDPDLHGPPLLPPEEPPPTLDELPAYIEKLKVDGEKLQAESKAKEIERLKSCEQIFAKLGFDFNIIRAEMETPHSGSPILPGEKDRKTLTDLIAKFKVLGIQTDEMDELLADADREKLRAIGDAGAKSSYLKSAHHQKPAPRMSVEQAGLARNSVIEAHAAGKSLKGVNLTGADLSDLDLNGIDFEEAYLENVNFENTDLHGANLRMAVLAHSSLRDAVLTAAVAQGANLGGANLCNAIIHNVDFSQAILSKADLTNADFSGTLLIEAELTDAIFRETNLSRTKTEKLVFLESDLSGINFSGAQMTKCSFLKVNVTGADFSGASLESSVFLSVKGESMLFRDADMTNVRFVEQCNFASSDFTGACLNKANLRGSQLPDCNFSKAQLDDSDLSECDLTRANFYRAIARNARFVKACLEDAIMASINAMNGSFQKADIRGVDLRGANLFQVDLARVRADSRTNLTDALTKKVRVYPRRIQ